VSGYTYVGSAATPGLPLVATPQPENVPPRIELSLTWAGNGSALVERLNPDGRWYPVRGAEPATVTGTWTGWDYEAPLGAQVTYRATSGGTVLTSAEVVLDSLTPWLVHPGVPVLSQPLQIMGWSARERPARQASFRVLGSRFPVTISAERAAPASTLTVRTETDAANDSMLSVLADGSVLLLNVPRSAGWKVEAGWVSVGDVTEDHEAPDGRDPARIWTLPVQLVDRPAGGIQGLWTVAGLAAERLTADDVVQGYYSVADLAAHRPRAATGQWTVARLAAELPTVADVPVAYRTVADLARHQAA
jgi:hypothetical protein